MSRTEDLRRGGASERTGQGSGGGPPFVKWGEDYSWVEGTVLDLWEGKYGMSAKLRVVGASDALEAKGKDEDGTPYSATVKPDMEVNVGLNLAALEGSIVEADKGKVFHVAFEGWQTPKDGGKPYRVFAVLEMERDGTSGPVDSNRPPMRGEPDRRPMTQAAAVGRGPGAPHEEGPPIEDYEDDDYR